MNQIELNIFSLIAIGGKQALQRLLCNNVSVEMFATDETRQAWEACLEDYKNYGNINMSRIATNLITQNRDGTGLINQVNATYTEMADIDAFCEDLKAESRRRKAYNMARDNLDRLESTSYRDILILP